MTHNILGQMESRTYVMLMDSALSRTPINIMMIRVKY